MASRRRKTLSHSEIENFLTEINTTTTVETIKSKPSQSPMDEFRLNVDVNIQSSSIAAPDACDAVVDRELSDREMVRKFCKVVVHILW